MTQSQDTNQNQNQNQSQVTVLPLGADALGRAMPSALDYFTPHDWSVASYRLADLMVDLRRSMSGQILYEFGDIMAEYSNKLSEAMFARAEIYSVCVAGGMPRELAERLAMFNGEEIDRATLSARARS